MLIKEAEAITGGLSKPSKMPGYSYNIHPKYCITGSVLRKQKGTVCSHCYGCKGRYTFSNVQNALERRKKALSDDRWVQAMTRLIASKKCPFFRWHDAGDIQSIEHLEKIFQVCRNTPEKKHWLPTKETGILAAFLKKGGSIPDNVTARPSAYLFDLPYENLTVTLEGVELPTSVSLSRKAVKEGRIPDGVFRCPAYRQEGFCGKCRACWDKDVKCVAYGEH